MKNLFYKKGFLLLTIAAFLVGGFFVANTALAATLTVSSDAINVAYRNAIVKAADHLLSQQNADGGWSWYGTPGTASDENLYGITAIGLLNAYQLTHKTEYLVGATLTANHLVAKEIPADATTDGIAGHKFYSSDIEFLAKIAQVTGITAYSNKATAVMNHFLSQPNRYCATGCATAQNIADFYHVLLPANPGFAEWEISGWVWAAKLTEQDVWGTALANIVKLDVLAPAYTSLTSLNAGKYYSIGLASALKSTALYTIENADIKTKLLAEQDANTGAITANPNDGVNQATAYSVLGFSATNDSPSAIKSAKFFVDSMHLNGGWTDLSEPSEVTEVNSEIIQAIYSVLPLDTFFSIQDAINAATDGDTINVAAGTYTEQITINKNLTLIGAGDTTIIQSPDVLTSTFSKSGNPMKPIITVEGVNANISYLKVDGLGKGDGITNTFFVGIGFHNAGGTLDHVTVIGVKETPANRDQQGEAILAMNEDISPRTLNITNNIVSDFQKNGITLSGSGLTVTVSGNHVTGSGANDQVAQNGIHIGTGVTGSVTGNTVSELRCDDSTCGNDWYTDFQAMAIVVAGAVGPITVSGNNVSNSDVGIYSELNSGGSTITNNILTGNRYFGMLFEKGAVAVSGGSVTGGGSNAIGIFNPSEHNTGTTTVHNVNISGNSIAGLKNDAGPFSVDATNNWWGAASGPGVVGPGTGDKVSTNVTFSPWCVNDTCTTPPTPPGNSGGGGRPPTTPPAPVTPAVPAKVETPEGCEAGNKFSTTTGRNCNAATPASPAQVPGKVLGAASFNFTKSLKNNSKGDEVMEVQKFLNTLGHNCGTADGKFGPKTKACVIKFQVANKLKGDGIIGALTRAFLNK